MKKIDKSIIVLTLICLVIAALLAAVNFITNPVITENDRLAAEKALLEVLPSGGAFEKTEFQNVTLPETVKEVYVASEGGYVFKLVTTGYSTGLTVMCGISGDGTVSGTKCLASTETLGAEKTYGEKLVGANASSISGVDTVSGATLTSTAYKNAVADAIKAAEALNAQKNGGN